MVVVRGSVQRPPQQDTTFDNDMTAPRVLGNPSLAYLCALAPSVPEPCLPVALVTVGDLVGTRGMPSPRDNPYQMLLRGVHMRPRDPHVVRPGWQLGDPGRST